MKTFIDKDSKDSTLRNEKKREQIENQFNFGDQDMELFGAKLGNKAERTRGGNKFVEEDEDKEYAKCNYHFV